MYDVTRMAAPSRRKSFCQVSGVGRLFSFDLVSTYTLVKNMPFIIQNIPYNSACQISFAFVTNPFISQFSIRLDSVNNIFLILAGIPLSRPSFDLSPSWGS